MSVSPGPAVEAEEVVMQAALASGAFQRAHALRRLLAYLWEHRANPPGEYAIALDVLGKRSDFDPKTDATVRVHVARLRGKLKEFFETEGRALSLRLVIPPGGHRLEVQDMAAVEPAEPAPPRPVWRHPAFLASAALALAFAIAAGAFWRRAERLERELARVQPAAELPAFWKRAIGNGKLTRIVIPTPVFFQMGRLRGRHVDLNDPEGIAKFPPLLELQKRFGKASLSQSYSVASDTLALAALTRIFSTAGIPVVTGVTRDLSLELFGSDNLVFLGFPPTSQHVDKLLARTEFYVKAQGQAVALRRPRPGEPAEFRAPAGRNVRHGIVAVLPGQGNGNRLVLLSGQHTAPLASFLTSPVTLKELDAYLASHGSPEYFEMVVESEVEGSKLLKATPVAFRTTPASFWK